MEENQIDENDEKIAIRTDLWHEMDVNRLQHQRDLILAKLAIITQTTQTPTIIRIYQALQGALNNINYMIDQNITASNPRSSQTSNTL